MPLKPCRQPGCPELVQGAWCETHSKIVDSSYRRGENHKFYDSKRWRVRKKRFLTRHPECACGCGRLAEVVDHIEPYVSEEIRSFWAETNWQGLTKSCHSKKTRRDVANRSFK